MAALHYLLSEQTTCEDQGQEKKLLSRASSLKSHLKPVPNKQGKETKGFTMFSGTRWKSDTNTFIQSIESEISKTEMAEIMEEAKDCLRTLASHANQDGAPIYEMFLEVPKSKII